jgi:deferrochelatase/peroxidase EfeB
MTVKLNNLDPKTPNKVVPLNHDDPRYTHMLADLQGNILKGHGRDHTVHIFLKFRKLILQLSHGLQNFQIGSLLQPSNV